MELVITAHEIQLGEYLSTLASFAEDYGQGAPALPEGATARQYIPGALHCLQIPGAQVEGGPLTWPAGDAIIAAPPRLLAAQAAREQAARQAEEAEAEAARQQQQQQGQGQGQQQGG